MDFAPISLRHKPELAFSADPYLTFISIERIDGIRLGEDEKACFCFLMCALRILLVEMERNRSECRVSSREFAERFDYEEASTETHKLGMLSRVILVGWCDTRIMALWNEVVSVLIFSEMETHEPSPQ